MCTGESGIEFWYSSVTPNDGVTTVIGIADQYGTRVVSANPRSFFQLNNQKLVFTADSGPKYLNSLQVKLEDTSNGQTDSNAQVVLDGCPSANPPGNPFGYNVIVNPSAPPTIPFPDYARATLGSAQLVISIAAAAGVEGGLLFADPILGAMVLGIDTYNTLVQDYRAAQQPQWSCQSSVTDSSPSYLHVWAAQDGYHTPNITPADASLAGKVGWTLTDQQREKPHHLTLTATVGYTDSVAQEGADTYSVSVTNQLDINPDYNVLAENFESENGVFNPNLWSATGSWQITNACPSFNGLPNCIQGTYLAWSGSQTNELAPLVMKIGNYVNYNQLVVYFHFWVSTNGTVSISYLSNGVWNSWTAYGGGISTSEGRAKTAYTQWINARMVIPSASTSLSFTYQTGSSDPGQGFYMDDIYIFGDGPGNSADVLVNGSTNTSPQQSVPISMDGGPYYYTTDHFLETKGSHTVTAQSFFTDGSGSYQFSNWLGGSTSTSMTITVPASALVANYVTVADFTVTSNPTSADIPYGSSKAITVYVTSRNGFNGPVTVTAYPPTGVSGITGSPSPTTVSLSSNGQVQYSLTISVANSVNLGNYIMTLTGTGAGPSTSAFITVSVTNPGGKGGSVAVGTLITLANGTQVSVQHLQAGMRLLSYDTATNQFVQTAITKFATVITNNTEIIHTTIGQTLTVDQNPDQKLYVMLPNGTMTMLSVTLLNVGYSLFNIPSMSWVQITSITYQTGGNHMMYDIYNDGPGNYMTNGYLDPQKN